MDEIIENAKAFIKSDEAKFEDVIADLEISKKSVVYEQERAEQFRKEAEGLKKEVEKQKKKIEEQKEKIIASAREEAKAIYQRAKEEADSIIKEMNRDARNKASQQKMNESRQKIKNSLANTDSEISKMLAKRRKKGKVPDKVNIGDSVYVVSLDTHANVLTMPDEKKEVFVQAGIMKFKVPVAELVIDDFSIQENTAKKNERKNNVSSKVRAGKSMGIKTEIDCRGQLVTEALGNVDKYIDDAYLAGLKNITIIHGKGTGALRSAVQEYLRKNPHVKSYRPGVYGEGETGVTVVELK